MDEPWIMTVKGPHGVKGSVVPMLPLDEQPASLTLTHTPNHNQQTKPHANGASRSPPKESTLNHYRSESRDSVRDGQSKHTPDVNSKEWRRLDPRPAENKQRPRSSQELKHPRSAVLSGVVLPLLSELQRKHQYSTRDNNGEGGSGISKNGGAIEELRSAFETAERNSPGMTEALVRELLKSLLPANHSEGRLSMLMEKVSLR
ncbi:Serine/threonine-protein kinase 25 [Dufourea novaeangliae]|uniref:Serine/threonine-protein kinase 25 n=1 Tax=Dufourea novaeangliae TaxID=178035 RepID=A0A154P5H0_DUFNO|nr:Serine/threonine-protein kinase 25 [Dufourea novaeangliae]